MQYDFNNKNTIQSFRKELDSIIESEDGIRGYKFALYMQKILDIPEIGNTLSQESRAQYDDMIITAKFLGLHRLSEEEFFKLLEEHFNKMFDIKYYNISSRVEYFLVTNFYFLPDRDEFKIKIRDFLLSNKILISKEKIKINGVLEDQSVQNWLKDFRNKYTEDGFLDPVSISEYFTSSENFNALSLKEKDDVKSIFDLYSMLKMKSSDLIGMEEAISIETPDGELAVLRHGEIEKIPREVYKLYDEIKDIMNPDIEVRSKKVFDVDEESKSLPKEEKNIDEKKSIQILLQKYKDFEDKMNQLDTKNLEQYKNNLDSLFGEFENYSKDKNKIFSFILFLVKNGLFNQFYKSVPGVAGLEFKKYLSTKFSESIVEFIVEHYENPESVSLFLQFLLNRSGINERESALFGMYIANIFKKNKQEKYFSIVYGDLNLESFLWRDVVEEAGIVKFK
ncbi:MAG: hypothetical protein PHZ07_04380 [Patescibacteria group bacterium]|nr:hypothetical protein [Patescibacteria group bacterium]MDD4303985.1 hypothetical protein [Patescibacteria group bacterium]MDD4695026.1 hypothetical protein [Patescibacteria group bacterium]